MSLFIARSTYDALCGERERLRQEVQEARSEVARLTDVIVSLKRQNYHPPESPGEPVVLEPPTPIQKAIQGLPRKVRGGVMGEVERWRGEGMTEQEIVRRIELGEEEYGAA